MHQNILFPMNFILAVKIPFKIQRGIFYEGRDEKSYTNILLFVNPVARVLANRNRTIETV